MYSIRIFIVEVKSFLRLTFYIIVYIVDALERYEDARVKKHSEYSNSLQEAMAKIHRNFDQDRELQRLMASAGYRPPFSIEDYDEASKTYLDRWLWDSGLEEDLDAHERLKSTAWFFQHMTENVVIMTEKNKDLEEMVIRKLHEVC